MKKILTLSFALMCILANLTAQENHLIVFSEDLDGFYAYVNGVKQNAEPQTNVKITGLMLDTYKVKIVFEDESIADIDKNIYFEPMGMANTAKITNTKKGYKLRFFGSVPLNQSPKNYTEYSYTTTDAVEETVEIEEVIEMDSDVQMNTNINVTETNSSRGAKETTEDNVSINMNLGGTNFNMDVNIKETSSGSIDMNHNVEVEETVVYEEVEYEAEEWVEEEVEIEPCYMTNSDFDSGLESIISKSFSDSKMTLAKQIAKSSCMTSVQIKQVMEVFDFEDDRLEFAKFAFGYCSDQRNYYKVNDAFEFESTIEELDEFLGN